jgi:putative methionine-R-sulfoxide reductase with GAF domain
MHRGARPDGPDTSIFGRDRRRSRRHRVHTPAYASLSGSSQSSVVELSEILDISESGMCIQASSQMKINRLLPLCLELSATGSRIYVVGHVVWSESSGKTGIRFPDVSAPELEHLQEWLAANANAEAVASVNAGPLPETNVDLHAVQSKPTSSPSYTSLVTEWAEIEKEVDSCGPDLDPALHLIAQRALTLTWASGTAIALINSLEPSEMVCRARGGSDSPEIGARLDSNSGFSGECVRTGTAIVCDDAEYDSRVDRKSCRALGIRSIVACPVKRSNEVIGILEVFSAEPAAFWENDVTVLQRLATFIVQAVDRAQYDRRDALAFANASRPASSVPFEGQPGSGASFSRRFHLRAVLIAAGILGFGVAIWAMAPWLSKQMGSSTTFSLPASAEADSPGEAYSLMNLSEIRRLAGQHDPRAQYVLGRRYANGDGVPKDYRAAKDLFLAAADQGHIAAQGKLAALFWTGKGVPQDCAKAYYWALLAQAGGDKQSPLIVVSCAARLSPAQTSAEQKQAEHWLHSHHIGKAE